MIAEERARLIKDCAVQVFDYMNQGDLTEEDIALLPQELQNKIVEMRRDRAFQQCGVGEEDRKVI